MIEAITFDDVLLIPQLNKFSSRKDVSIVSRDSTKKLTLDLPIMTANMDTITDHKMANYIHQKGGVGVLHRFMSVEDNIKEFLASPADTFVSIGASNREIERFEALLANGANFFCVDVAHGHAQYVRQTISEMRNKAGDNVCIMAGNVATKEGAHYLAESGADIIKVGIGPGSVCTTRIKTGFGVPQLSAIMECSDVDRSIVADGGIKSAGDVVKALAFGADFVMLGGLLAGTQPTPGDPIVVQLDGKLKQVKKFRGMASKEVADDYLNGLTSWRTAEGVSLEIPYREDQDAIIADIVGGLRSGLTYAGAGSIKELQSTLKYVVITNSGRMESVPHKML
jgi:IMP dehydrogenase